MPKTTKLASSEKSTSTENSLLFHTNHEKLNEVGSSESSSSSSSTSFASPPVSPRPSSVAYCKICLNKFDDDDCEHASFVINSCKCRFCSSV